MKFTEKVRYYWENNKDEIVCDVIFTSCLLTVAGFTAYCMSKHACDTIDAHTANVPNGKLGAMFVGMCDEVYTTGTSATRRIHNGKGERFNATLTLTPVK